MGISRTGPREYAGLSRNRYAIESLQKRNFVAMYISFPRAQVRLECVKIPWKIHGE